MRRAMIATVVLVLGSVGLMSPAWARTPKYQMNHGNVYNRSKVHYKASGLKPGTVLYVGECNVNFPTDGVSACVILGQTVHTADSTGKVGKTEGIMTTGPIGTDGGSCYQPSENDTPPPCTWEFIQEKDGSPDLSTAYGIPIPWQVTP